MKCPSCNEALPALAERCSGCGAMVAPPVEGALAPKPRTVTPPPRDKVKRLQDLPGMPKKERTWRDEVQERVSRRKKKRKQSSLPLFEQPEVVDSSETESATEAGAKPSDLAGPRAPEAARPQAAPPAAEELEARSPLRSAEVEDRVAERDFESAPLSEEELADLPLRAAEPFSHVAAGEAETSRRMIELTADIPDLDEDLVGAREDGEQPLTLDPPPTEATPLERPARISERAQAAVVDAGILVVLGSLVVYFAGRAARVDVTSLLVSWPWLVSYLALLGVFYAGYFTGTTGQTPGKMIAGLRVVDARGRPPSYVRASLRAIAGAAGTVLAGLGLVPMALDPARRALHDRLLRTRVIHR
jgi:uncharacterized RDD family membrane protein YckC